MKTFFKNTKLIAALVAAPMMALASASQAETVLVDFSTATPEPGVADSNGNRWNTVGTVGTNSVAANFPATALIDTTGASVPWQIAYTGSGNTNTGFGGNGINGPAGPAPLDQSFAVIDGIFSQNSGGNGVATITYTGLAANSVYNLSLIGGRASSGEDGVITVTTGTGPGGALLNDGTVLSFAATSDASGSIAFTFNEGVNTSNVFNGSTLNAMSITGTTIPEPTSLALLGLGGLLVARRRRD